MAAGDAIPLRGKRAVINWFYHVAAEVHDYTIVYDKGARVFTVRGGVVAPDGFRLKQTPLTFAIHRPNAPALRWAVVGVNVADGRIMARLTGLPGADI